MHFEVVTLFPAAIEHFVGSGLLGKATERGALTVTCTNPRDFAQDRHRTVDDVPYGGGAGMVLKADVVAAALDDIAARRGPMHVVLLTPSGRPFDQASAWRLAQVPRVALLCGRYEGIDDRIRETRVDECLSLGDFVLNGGEVAALAIIEAVARLGQGFVGNPQSITGESFHGDPWGPLLEHPHYTRPPVFAGHAVPQALVAGDHLAIARWRRAAALIRTWALRPELRPLPIAANAVPVILAVEAQAPNEWAMWVDLARRVGAKVVAVGHHKRSTSTLASDSSGEEIYRDLREVRRTIRKTSGNAPWVIGVVDERPHVEDKAEREAPVARSDSCLEFPWFPHSFAAIFDYLRGCAAELESPSGPQVAKFEPSPAVDQWPTVVLYLPKISFTAAQAGAAREGAAREGAAREGAAREGAAREGAAQECAAQECAAPECAARKSATNEMVAVPKIAPTLSPDLWLRLGSTFLEKDLANALRMTDPSQPPGRPGSRLALAAWALERLSVHVNGSLAT